MLALILNNLFTMRFFYVKSNSLGISGGILWGLGMSFCTIIAIYTGYSPNFLNLMADIYPGYTISWLGILVGFIYGFLDAFFGLFLLAWIYNKLNTAE